MHTSAYERNAYERRRAQVCVGESQRIKSKNETPQKGGIGTSYRKLVPWGLRKSGGSLALGKAVRKVMD